MYPYRRLDSRGTPRKNSVVEEVKSVSEDAFTVGDEIGEQVVFEEQ
jgi:hypothetical protein